MSSSSEHTTGVEIVFDIYSQGSEEIKSLLRNECELVYECRLPYTHYKVIHQDIGTMNHELIFNLFNISAFIEQ